MKYLGKPGTSFDQKCKLNCQRKKDTSSKLYELIIEPDHFQPMIQYINHKDIYGPFSKKADVYLPHSAEVTSAKYTNM